MENQVEISEFNRSKIYETLDYQPEPANYKSEVPWIVQQQIAATNGRHYIDIIGKLKHYPVFELPINKVTGQKIMLDIGNGWGRWLVAGASKGYVPVGVDIRLEFCKTSRRVLSDLNKTGYSIVADLENLPFKDNVFDLVWSFSVIQHTHIKRLRNCLSHIQRILTDVGFTYLEFPNKDGIRNRFGPVKDSLKEADDYNSWAVRYYTPGEYQAIFNEFLAEFEFDNHSFLGIGMLREDLKYVSMKNKVLCAASLFGSFFANHIPGIKNYSDSIYIKASKGTSTDNLADDNSRSDFFSAHQANPSDNLNIAFLVRCPLTGKSLRLNAEKNRLVNESEGFYYPVVDSIPILICDERQGL